MPETSATFYDRQEVRSPADREASLFHALPGLLRHALDNAQYFADHLAGIDPDTVANRADLARLPVLRKSDLYELQTKDPPFGRLTATPLTRLARIYASPGPIYDPEGMRPDYWRFARAMYAAGFRSGDIVHNSFSYHLTPAGAMAESGARALGLPVIPGGTAPIELQLQALAHVGATAYAGTPKLPARPLGEGSRAGDRHPHPGQGSGIGRGLSCRRARAADGGVRAACGPMLRQRRSRAGRLREPSPTPA